MIERNLYSLMRYIELDPMCPCNSRFYNSRIFISPEIRKLQGLPVYKIVTKKKSDDFFEYGAKIYYLRFLKKTGRGS